MDDVIVKAMGGKFRFVKEDRSEYYHLQECRDCKDQFISTLKTMIEKNSSKVEVYAAIYKRGYCVSETAELLELLYEAHNLSQQFSSLSN